MVKKDLRVLLTGGGTGGHVQPALAVAKLLKQMAIGNDSEIGELTLLYVGNENGVEARLSRDAGIEFKSVAVGKLRRSSKGVLGLVTLKNLVDLFRVPLGVFQSIAIVWRFKPDVLLGTGGFVIVPPVLASALLRRKIVLHEQSAAFGLANRLTATFATKVALSVQESLVNLASGTAKKAVVTGNPIRSECFDGDRQRALATFFPDLDAQSKLLPLLYVTGGANGSHLVNETIVQSVDALTKNYLVLHQCGQSDFEQLSNKSTERYKVVKFVSSTDIGDVFAAAHLVIARSGAGTTAELCALAKPSILVPLEPTSGDEQLKNARRLEKLGACIVIAQSEFTPTALLAALDGLDGPKLAEMSNAAKSLAASDPTLKLTQLLLDVANNKTA